MEISGTMNQGIVVLRCDCQRQFNYACAMKDKSGEMDGNIFI